MENERIAYLLQKYIHRSCTTAEFQEFMELVADEGAHLYIDKLLDDYWEKSDPVPLDQRKADQIFNQLIKSPTVSAGRQQKIKTWWGWVAAILCIGISLVWFNQKTVVVPELANVQQKQLQVSSDSTIIAKTTNEHQKVTLPDGSTVILNKHSSITYPKIFGKERNVILKGEGYFDIKHDEHKSFTVYTGKIKTTVLGTAFNINAYDEAKNIKVTVTRGKVSVLEQETLLGVLTANQQIIFQVLEGKDQKAKVAKVDAKAFVQWQENDFFFDEVSMEEAIQILSAKFNVPITFTNNGAKKCRFTATFLKGESLDEILKVICSFNNAQYQTSATGVTITGDGC